MALAWRHCLDAGDFKVGAGHWKILMWKPPQGVGAASHRKFGLHPRWRVGSCFIQWQFIGFDGCFQAFDGDGIPEGIVLHHANWIAQISKLDQNWFGKCQSDQIALRIGAPLTKIRNYATDSGNELAADNSDWSDQNGFHCFADVFFRDCQKQEIQRRNWCIKPVPSLVHIFFGGWTLLKADAWCLPIL